MLSMNISVNMCIIRFHKNISRTWTETHKHPEYFYEHPESLGKHPEGVYEHIGYYCGLVTALLRNPSGRGALLAPFDRPSDGDVKTL